MKIKVRLGVFRLAVGKFRGVFTSLITSLGGLNCRNNHAPRPPPFFGNAIQYSGAAGKDFRVLGLAWTWAQGKPKTLKSLPADPKPGAKPLRRPGRAFQRGRGFSNCRV